MASEVGLKALYGHHLLQHAHSDSVLSLLSIKNGKKKISLSLSLSLYISIAISISISIYIQYCIVYSIYSSIVNKSNDISRNCHNTSDV